MKKYAFGVDIGGTTVKIGLFETNGELSQKWEIPTRKEGNGSKILPDIAASLNDKLKELDIPKEEVAGVGIDVPGPILDDEIVKCAARQGQYGRVRVRFLHGERGVSPYEQPLSLIHI